MSNHRASLEIGVTTTGMRWSKGRNMVDHTGKARYDARIHAEPAATSPQYLSEERILIGDLLAAGPTQQSDAAEFGRSLSTTAGQSGAAPAAPAWNQGGTALIVENDRRYR